MNKYLILTIKLFVLLFSVHSQGGELIFSHLVSENGLSSNIIHSVLQDHEGFVWIGSNDGLNRYDGYEFMVFKHNALDTNTISSNTIFQLFEDSHKRLWIAGSTGICLFMRETMSFKRVPLFENNDSSYYSSYTRDIIENNDSIIFIANTNGIYRYNEEIQAFVRFSIDDAGQQEGIRSMHIDSKNRVWIGSVGYGLLAYDLGNHKSLIQSNGDDILGTGNRIFVISEDENGDIWLGTDKGVFIVSSDLSTIYPLQRENSSINIQIEDVWDIKFEGNLVWLGTDGGGLLRYNRNDHSIIQFLHDEYDNTSLSSNTVRSICLDRQGLLWLGTFYGGLDYAQYHLRKEFGHMKSDLNNPNALSHNAVCAIYEDSQAHIWIGTDKGGVDKYSAEWSKLAHYEHEPNNPNSLNGNSVLAIAEDSKGNIWTGGYEAGVNIINPYTGKIKSFRHEPKKQNTLSSNNVWGIYIDADDVVWITTNEGGLNKYDIAKDTFVHYKSEGKNSLVTNWAIRVYPDSRGNLWIGTYNGLSVFNPETEQFFNYAHSDNPGSLSNNWVYAFAEDKLGNMWIGTANGLNYFDTNTKKFKVFNRSNGLPNEVIKGLLFDNKDNLWISTNAGLSKFNPDSQELRSYNYKDGLRAVQFIHGACFKGSDGKMFFGGEQGLNCFYPDSIKLSTYKPPVHLTSLLLNFKEVEIDAKNSPLQKAINYTDILSLTHKQSTFTIKYTAINFVNSTKNQFAYLLEGYDQDWNYVDDRREATYTNLNPGKYLFKVKASNNDEIWSDNEATLSVVISPPWWKTWLFRILVVLVIISLGIFVYRLRLQDLKNKKIQLEKEVERRTAEIKDVNELLRNQANELNENNIVLEERQRLVEEQAEELQVQKEDLLLANENLKELNSTKDRFFSIIAHDLKNPFGTIVGFAEIFRDRYAFLDDEKKRLYIESIYDAASNVLNLLDNLLDWARSQSNQVKLIKVRLSVNEILQGNINLIKDMANAKNLKISITTTDNLSLYADSNMTNAIFRNIITNAIKFSENRGEIILGAENTGEYIQFSVTDKGIGIPESDLKGIFNMEHKMSRPGTDGESGTGLGLTLCKEYVEKHGGVIWVESIENKGSTFYFTLPSYTNRDSMIVQ